MSLFIHRKDNSISLTLHFEISLAGDSASLIEGFTPVPLLILQMYIHYREIAISTRYSESVSVIQTVDFFTLCWRCTLKGWINRWETSSDQWRERSTFKPGQFKGLFIYTPRLLWGVVNSFFVLQSRRKLQLSIKQKNGNLSSLYTGFNSKTHKNQERSSCQHHGRTAWSSHNQNFITISLSHITHCGVTILALFT